MITEINAPTLIAEGSRVQGALTFFSGTQIHGIVEGEVIQQSLEKLVVGKTGWVHGSLSSRGPIIVEGRVEGNIYSSSLIRLLPTAQVTGSIVAPSVEVRPGAIFEGDFVMRWAKNRSESELRAA